MKEKLLILLKESSKDYWDKSEGTYDNFSESDDKLVDEIDHKLADDIIKLFKSK